MTWDDEALVEGLKARDSAAVQHAVELYVPKLYRYAAYQLGDLAAAEDLASEVITRMLEKIDSYTYTGVPLQRWLFQIARNLVADAYRRQKRADVVSLESYLRAGSASEPVALDRKLEALPDRERLMSVLLRLTDEQRQVVTLRLVEGWEPAEIAALLGRSVDSVKSLQYRAIQMMRRYLEQDSNLSAQSQYREELE